jgi:hypothetical protein
MERVLGGAYLMLDGQKYLLDYYKDGMIAARMITGFVNDTFLREEEGQNMRQIAVNGSVKQLPVSVSSFQKKPSGQHSTVNVTINLNRCVTLAGHRFKPLNGEVDSKFASICIAILKCQMEGKDLYQALSYECGRIPYGKIVKVGFGYYVFEQDSKHYPISGLLQHLFEPES